MTELSFTQVPLVDFATEYKIDQEFLDIVNQLMLMSKFYVPDGMWIAGGCFGRFMRGETLADFHTDQEITPSVEFDANFDDWISGRFSVPHESDFYFKGDIDIFFATDSTTDKFLTYLKTHTESFNGTKLFKVESSMASSIILHINNYRIKIQLIHYEYFNSPENVLSSFDLSCCMFATDGFTVTFENNRSIKDALTKTSQFNKEKLYNSLQDGTANSFIAMRRFQKYIKQGFSIDNKQLGSYIEYIQSIPKDPSKVLSANNYNWIPKKIRKRK